jgi:hypothetical protein
VNPFFVTTDDRLFTRRRRHLARNRFSPLSRRRAGGHDATAVIDEIGQAGSSCAREGVAFSFQALLAKPHVLPALDLMLMTIEPYPPQPSWDSQVADRRTGAF